jgi:hypothetical protein
MLIHADQEPVATKTQNAQARSDGLNSFGGPGFYEVSPLALEDAHCSSEGAGDANDAGAIIIVPYFRLPQVLLFSNTSSLHHSVTPSPRPLFPYR